MTRVRKLGPNRDDVHCVFLGPTTDAMRWRCQELRFTFTLPPPSLLSLNNNWPTLSCWWWWW